MRNDDDIIVLNGLTKLYEPTPAWMRVFARSHLRETVRALDGVDLVVRAGEICAVVGPNGAGKTTMFRIIVGLTSATSGTGSVLGLDVERDSEQIRQVVGWMPSEDRSLLMRATSAENLQLHGRLQGMPRKDLAERISYVLEIVNLTPQTHTVVAGLSAGMRARLRLARALLPGPRALILDEPTGPVDPIAAYGLLTLIMDLAKQERLAVLISSHRLEEIEALRSQALLLDGGKVRYAGDLDSLRKEWERPEIEFVAINHQAAGSIADGLLSQGIEAKVDELSVRCRPAVQERLGTILSRLGPATTSIAHVREIPMPLRDLIAQVYSRGGQA
jgi:ABC-2 type transport system ATP-binding protein